MPTQPKVYSILLDLIEKSTQSFSVMDLSVHLEIAADIEGQRVPRRCRLKLFEVKPGQMAAFFYKTSAVPFSRDRFSYGAIVFPTNSGAEQDFEGWLDYLASGFDWDRTPPNLRRALTFDVPD